MRAFLVASLVIGTLSFFSLAFGQTSGNSGGRGVDPWAVIANTVGRVCSTVSYYQFESLRWVCTFYRTAEQAIEYWNEIRSDFESLKSQGIYTAIGYAVDWLGDRIGLSEVNKYADSLQNMLTGLMSNWRRFREELSQMMRDIRQKQIEAIRNNTEEPYTPDWWLNVFTKLSPLTFGKTLATMTETSRLTSDIVQSASLTAAATKKVMEATDPKEGVAEAAGRFLATTAPTVEIPGLGKVSLGTGAAEALEKEAATAVSSRQVLEVLVKAEAENLRAQAVNTEAIIAELRNIAMQSTISNYQLGLEVREILRHRIDEVNEWKAEMEEAVAEVQTQAKGVGDLAKTVVEYINNAWKIGNPNYYFITE